jgi:hypothetical protein
MTTSLPVIQGVFLSEHMRTARSPISFGSANLLISYNPYSEQEFEGHTG